MGKRSVPSGRVVGIDPGKHFYSWAVVEGLQLRACGLVRTELHRADSTLPHDLYMADLMVCEMPVVRPDTPRANDLIPLAAMVGAVAAAADPRDLSLISPTRWKGNRVKKVDHRAIRLSLHESEMPVLELGLGFVKKSLQHNVWDAVGIALWAVHRKK